MGLRDHINELLDATPQDAEVRRTTLTDLLSATEAAGEADAIQTITRLIAEREQKAGSFAQAGQSDMARRVREEIATMREVLRHIQAPEPDKPTKPAKKPSVQPAEPEAEKKPLFSRRQTMIAAAGGGVVLLVAAIWIVISLSGHNQDIDLGKPQPLVLNQDDHTMGDPNAPVTLLEFAAPTCPHCAHFFLDIFPKVKKEYIDTGKVFYVFRAFPLMPADGAAEAIARCLPEDKYFAFLDHLFRNQKEWDPEYSVTDVRGGLIRISRVAGLNAAKVDECMANKAVIARMNAIADAGRDQYDIEGVPTFVINGYKQKSGSISWEAIKAKLDAELAKAKKK